MRVFLFLCCCFSSFFMHAQPVAVQLKTAMNAMEKDEQFSHASIGFYVVNSNTGQVVFDKNAQVGLVPASTQKVVTSAAAYELLGKDFTYETTFSLNGKISENAFSGDFNIQASGDPTFGSWRWEHTSRKKILSSIANTVKTSGIATINGTITMNEKEWSSQATPDGWIWEDIGNYYGAGASILNWNENSYNLNLKPGKNIGDSVKIISTDPEIHSVIWKNELTTAKQGSGDNAVIYLPENGFMGYIRGTIPAGVEKFTIRGASPFGETVFFRELKKEFNENQVIVNSAFPSKNTNPKSLMPGPLKKNVLLATFKSPPLDSVNYWFMKESINLYGEAFVKTIGYQKKGFGSTNNGLDIIKDFWKSKGIDNAELKIRDGSGLSPANRLTPHALVTILQYAKKQGWFASFYHSLPLQNNIKMKSGYIGGVRSYAGYVQSKTGEEYTFSFIINNFDGSPATVREKMWKLLDLLK